MRIEVKKVVGEVLTRTGQRFDVRNLTKYTPLVGKGLGLDSITLLELIVGLEKKFEIDVDETELNVKLFENIQSMAHDVSEKLNHAGFARSLN